METIGSVTIETSPSDMNYQSPKALQAQSKNRAIKPAIQSKFEFDSKIHDAEKHDFRKFKPHKQRHNQHKEAHDKDGMGRRNQYEEAYDKGRYGTTRTESATMCSTITMLQPCIQTCLKRASTKIRPCKIFSVSLTCLLLFINELINEASGQNKILHGIKHN